MAVLADDRAGVGVGDHPEALLGRIGLVDRHDDRARGGRAHVGVGPLGSRVGEDAHALARLDTEVDQPQPYLLDDLGELGVVDIVPGAVALVAHRRVIGVRGGRTRDQVGDRARPGGGRLGGSGLHVQLSSSWIGEAKVDQILDASIRRDGVARAAQGRRPVWHDGADGCRTPHTGFGTSRNTWRTPKRWARCSPSCLMPKVSVA